MKLDNEEPPELIRTIDAATIHSPYRKLHDTRTSHECSYDLLPCIPIKQVVSDFKHRIKDIHELHVFIIIPPQDIFLQNRLHNTDT